MLRDDRAEPEPATLFRPSRNRSVPTPSRIGGLARANRQAQLITGRALTVPCPADAAARAGTITAACVGNLKA
jgi:hypothetical protein